MTKFDPADYPDYVVASQTGPGEGMKHSDFRIGLEFVTATGRWRCTDVGSRTIGAIRIDPVELVLDWDDVETRLTLTMVEAEAEGWFNGPPYALAEQLFNEDDFEGCEPAP